MNVVVIYGGKSGEHEVLQSVLLVLIKTAAGFFRGLMNLPVSEAARLRCRLHAVKNLLFWLCRAAVLTERFDAVKT